VSSGHDSVFVTDSGAPQAVRAMLDGIARTWPDMIVAVTGVRGDEFAEWSTVRDELPEDAGELLVARDASMEARWDEVGYALMEGGEGPFALYYRRAPRPVVRVRLLDDPYEHGSEFEPYEATMVSSGMYLVTIVTPGLDSPFSRGLLDLLRQALLAPPGNGQQSP
jgi:hypothetical protein